MIAIFLMSFTCSSRKWFCRKSQRYRGLCRQNAGHAESKQPGPGSFPRPLWLPWCPGLYLTYCERLLHVPEVSADSMLVLHLQEMLGALKLLLGQLEEEVSGPSPVEPQCLHRNRSPERIFVDEEWDPKLLLLSCRKTKAQLHSSVFSCRAYFFMRKPKGMSITLSWPSTSLNFQDCISLKESSSTEGQLVGRCRQHPHLH